MNKLLIAVVIILGFISVNGIETHTLCNHEIDSLKQVIKTNDYEIKMLVKSCRDKESEISYWGHLYEECKKLK